VIIEDRRYLGKLLELSSSLEIDCAYKIEIRNVEENSWRKWFNI